MTNLLPPAAKKEIVFEYWTRVLCAWIILWSLCMSLGAVLLLPTYVLLSGLSANNASSLESTGAEAGQASEYESLRALLTSSSAKAETIATLSQVRPLSELLGDVWEQVDSSVIDVRSVTLQRENGELQPLTVTGEAADRQSLDQFRTDLESLSFVSSVDLPFTNLAKNEDISFSLTGVIDKE